MLMHLEDPTSLTQAWKNDTEVGNTMYLRIPQRLDYLGNRINSRNFQLGNCIQLVKEQEHTADGRLSSTGIQSSYTTSCGRSLDPFIRYFGHSGCL